MPNSTPARLERLEDRRLLAAAVEVTSLFGTPVNDGAQFPLESNGTDFGVAFVGDTRPFRPFQITNTSATDDLDLGPLSVPAGFQIEQGLPGVLGPGSSTFFTISLAADAQQQRSGTVQFTTNVPGKETFDFAVTGRLDPATPTPGNILPAPLGIFENGTVSRREGADLEGLPTEIIANQLFRFPVPQPPPGQPVPDIGFAVDASDGGSFGADGEVELVVIRDADADGALDLAELNQPALQFTDPPGNGPSMGAASLTVGTYFALLRVGGFQETNPAAAPPTVVLDYILTTGLALSTSDVSVSFSGVVIADGDTTPSAVDGTNFGSAPVGQAGPERTYTVTNTGDSLVLLGPATLDPGPFLIVSNVPPSLAGGTSATFTVRMSTTTTGAKAGNVILPTNVPGKDPYNFSVAGTVIDSTAPEIDVALQGVGPLVDAQAGAVDFGSVIQGMPGSTRTFVVSNTGTATLTLGAVALPAGFTLTEPLAASLAPGSSDTFTVALDSASTGNKTGSLSVATNDADENPFDIPLQGAVLAPGELQTPDITVFLEGGGSVEPEVNFGSSVQGQVGATRRFIVRNDGLGALNLGAASVTGGFAITEQLNTVLAPGDSDGFTVTISTAGSGAITGSVTIPSNDPDENPVTIALRGNVVQSGSTPDAEITVLLDGSPATPGQSVDFGTIAQGAFNPEREITLRNDGTAALTLGEPVLPSGFVLVQAAQLATSLAPGQSVVLHVALSSASAGTFTGPATIVSSDTDEGAFVLNLSGSVTTPQSAVSGLSVGNVIAAVPTTVIAGTRTARGVVAVPVTNTSSNAAFKGAVTFTVVASSDELPGPADATLAVVTRKLKLKPGATRTIKLKVKFPATTPQGQTNLLVSLAGAGVSALGVAGAQVSVQQPFVHITGLVGGPPAGKPLTFGRRATFLTPLQNAGNVPTSKSPATFELIVSRDGTEASKVFETTSFARIKLKPNTSKPQKLAVTFPPGAFAAGSYVLIVKLLSADLNQTNGQNVSGIAFSIA